MSYYLGLGSNLGDPEGNLRRARAWLKKLGFKILAASSLYRSEPVDFADQPWFLNQVIEVETHRTPLEVLNAVKEIEKSMKRRPSVRNGPRIIDIDILLGEDTVIRTKVLTVPHPRLSRKEFRSRPVGRNRPGRRSSDFKKNNFSIMAFIPGFIASGVLEIVMKKSAFILFVLGVFATHSFALEIRGKVVSTEGPSVADAVVMHRASGAQAITDQEGRFVLKIDTAGRATLLISHPAYMEKEISLSDKDMLRPLTVTLAPYIRQTQEVIVTALRYPEPVNKIPAAETIVSTEVLRERMAPNITEALVGIPGVVPLGSRGIFPRADDPRPGPKPDPHSGR